MKYNNVLSSEIAYVIYTSGSTGKPKGAIIEHAGMLNHIYAKLSDLDMTENDVVAQIASQSFDISIWQMFSALCIGGTTVVIDDDVVYKPMELFKVLKKNKVTILEVVPAYLSLLLDHANDCNILDGIKYLLVTGETLKHQLVVRFFEKFPNIKLVNAYGPTEASDDICHHIMSEKPSSTVIPVGKPLDNLNLYIKNDEMELCPTGFPGEICVSGVGVGRGYLNNPEKTASAFVHDDVRLYKTGDIGKWLPDGNIQFLGRKDDQIKIRSYRIEPGEIEQAIMTNDNVKECIVMLREEENKGDKYLVAFLLLNIIGKDIDTTSIKEYLADLLPEYMIPHNYVVLDSIPLTPNGKTDKKALARIKVKNRLTKNTKMVLPANTIEKKLLGVSADILDKTIKDISVTDSFFDLGGDSLKVIMLSSRIKKEFEVELSIAELFNEPNIREIAKKIEKGDHVNSTHIPISNPQDSYPLTSAQKGIYFEYMFNPASVNYVMPVILKLSGTVEVVALRAIFNKIINRHKVFKTGFELKGEEPTQFVVSNVKFDIEVFREDNPETVLNKYIQPFDLAEPPLIKVIVLKPSSQEKPLYLLINLHHIICDGYSIDILKNEFINFFKNEHLSMPPLQFTDYIVWQNSKDYRRIYDKQKKYWITCFDFFAPNRWLNVNYSNVDKHNKKGGIERLTLNEELFNSVMRFVLKNDVTISVFLLSVYYILVSKELEKNNVVIGVPVTGRVDANLENIVGMFVNVLPLKNEVVKEKRFKSFMREVKNSMIAGVGNQLYPYQDLVVSLRKKKIIKDSALFNIMFSTADMETEINLKPSNITISTFNYNDYYSPDVKTDINMRAYIGKSSINVDMEYATSLFDKMQIDNLLNDYETIISKLITVEGNVKIDEIINS